MIHVLGSIYANNKFSINPNYKGINRQTPITLNVVHDFEDDYQGLINEFYTHSIGGEIVLTLEEAIYFAKSFNKLSDGGQRFDVVIFEEFPFTNECSADSIKGYEPIANEAHSLIENFLMYTHNNGVVTVGERSEVMGVIVRYFLKKLNENFLFPDYETALQFTKVIGEFITYNPYSIDIEAVENVKVYRVIEEEYD